jgi:hypothetical protein
VAQFQAMLFAFKQFVVHLLELLVFQKILLFQLLRLPQKLMELTIQLLKHRFVLHDGEVQFTHRLLRAAHLSVQGCQIRLRLRKRVLDMPHVTSVPSKLLVLLRHNIA